MKYDDKPQRLKNRRFQQIVVWGLLLVGTAPVLYALVTSIQHVYAQYGVALFLMIAIPVALFVPRRRGIIIGIVAALVATTVVTLHIVTRNVFVIENRTGQVIEYLDFYYCSIQQARIMKIRAGQKVTLTIIDWSYPQGISVSGVMENRKSFPPDPLDPLGWFDPQEIQVRDASSRRVHIVIDSQGGIQMTRG
ncbi:MAG: hypothetical protein ACKVT0_21265 [Planctomycetaceae bacterium]